MKRWLSWKFIDSLIGAIILLISSILIWKQRESLQKFSIQSLSELSSLWYYTSIFIAAIFIIIILILILWLVPEWQIKRLQKTKALIKTDDLFSLKNEARRTVAQILGGFLVIAGLLLTGAQLAVTSKLTQEGQITDRFTKAIEHLGNKEKLEVRLGGIYALERIARDSEKDHWTIMEVLTAYVRENSPRMDKNQPLKKQDLKKRHPNNDKDTQNKIKTDIQAILTVIGRREKRKEPNQLDLRNTNLQRANLSEADLSGADLSGVDLSNANLSGANLSRANLSEAVLIEAELMDATLNWAKLRGANISKANLGGAKVAAADLGDADLGGANISWADLRLTDLSRANLNGTNLHGVNLAGATLIEANLSMAKLSGADLAGAALFRANLGGANLSTVTLGGANIGNTNIINPLSAFLGEVRNLTLEQISEASIDDETKLPAGIEEKYKDELKAMRETTRKAMERMKEK